MSIILELFNKSIEEVKPASLFDKSLSIKNKKILINSKVYSSLDNVKFISFGKAGLSMGEAFIKVVGINNIKGGIIVTPESKEETGFKNSLVDVCFSTHPFISEKSVSAGSKVLDFAKKCTNNDNVFCLISGGGSALLASPIKGIDVKEKMDIINKLIKTGVGEREVNLIRKKISRIKGGALAEALYPAKIINLIISDERDHQIEAIASGPTVVNKSKLTALDVIKKHNLWKYLPKHLHKVFLKNLEISKKKYPTINSTIIGSRINLIDAIKKNAGQDNYKVKILDKFHDKNIDQLKKKLSIEYSKLYKNNSGGKHLIIATGEVPVRVKSINAKGGRNQHLGALMIDQLRTYKNFEFLAISTDGCDFLPGVHGVRINEEHILKIDEMKINIQNYIDNFRTYEIHKKINSIIEGPLTGTNVNDFYLFYFFS